jgi:zinc protease
VSRSGLAAAVGLGALLASGCASAPGLRESDVDGRARRRGATPQASTKGRLPVPERALALRPPVFESFTLGNGVSVYVRPEPDLPLVAVGLVVRLGVEAIGAQQAGLTALLSRLLLDGTADRDALDLAAAFAEHGARPESAITEDGLLLSATVLAEHAAPTLALLAETVRAPRFDESELARQRERALTALRRRGARGTDLGEEAILAEILGEEHPLAQPLEGRVSTLERASRADLVALHRRLVGPASTAIVLVGRVSKEEARLWADKALGGWQAPVETLPRPRAPTSAHRLRVQLLPRPGRRDVRLLLGRALPPAGHPDENALRVAGNLYTARMNSPSRRRQGLVEQGEVRVVAHRAGGYLLFSAVVDGDLVHETLRAALASPGEIAAVTDVQLSVNRGLAVFQMARDFGTLDGICRAAAAIFLRREPPDAWRTHRARLARIDGASMRDIVRRYLDEDSLTVLLEGDPEIVRRETEKAGLRLEALATP